MSYTIKASRIKPGMTVTEAVNGITRTATVNTVEFNNGFADISTADGGVMCVPTSRDVEVEGDEPAPVHPVGTVVNIPGVGVAVKTREDDKPWVVASSGTRTTDRCVALCVGVTVVYTPGDTAASEVPERVGKVTDWPEDDTAYKAYEWIDKQGDTWYKNGDGWSWYGDDGKRDGAVIYETPICFPLTRV